MTARARLWRAFTPRRMLVVAVIVAVLVVAHYLGAGPRIRELLDWIGGLGAVGPLVFIAIYIVACVAFVPGSILTLGAGFLFGVIWGSIYVSIAATLGATGAFLIGRYLARAWVARQLADRPNFEAIDRAVAREGWKIVLLTRLSPIFPFNLLNYAYGLTQVGLRDYFFASWIGMIPGTVMFVYLGSLAGNLARVGARQTKRPAAEWALYGLGLAATIAVVIYVTRIGSRALKQRA